MPRNELLRQAVLASGLSVADLARRIDVDAKTVERWISRGRIPHPRHRVRAAEVLRKDVDVLWPEVARRTLKIGADRELVGVYPRRSDMPRQLFRDLIGNAHTRLWFGGYTSYFLWLDVPGLAATLAAKAGATDIRFLLGDPQSTVTRQREQIEATPLSITTRVDLTRAEISKAGPLAVRYSDRHIAMSVWIFDDDAIVATHIGAGLGQDSVTLHLRRRDSGGVFDRYVEHFESLWQSARSS